MSTPPQRGMSTDSVGLVRCLHGGTRHHPCSIATVSGKGEEAITQRVHSRHSAVKVCTIKTVIEGIPPIENAMLMNNGGGIGTRLATTTRGEWHLHRFRRGDHTRDQHSWIGTGSDSSVGEKGTGMGGTVTGNESGTAISADWYRPRHRREGIGTTTTDGLGSHPRHRSLDWIQRE